MRIDLEVTQDVAAARDRVWERLLDPQFVAGCAPGVEKVESTGENQFRVTAGMGVGPIRVRFRLDVALSDLKKPESAKLTVSGKAPGSEVRAEGTVRLETLEPAKTRLQCAAAIDVSGMIVAMGGKNLPATARSIAGQFFRTFADRVAKG